ncbi:MAG: hypothetical protein Q9163_005775, partial [Psora crenata]
MAAEDADRTTTTIKAGAGVMGTMDVGVADMVTKVEERKEEQEEEEEENMLAAMGPNMDAQITILA